MLEEQKKYSILIVDDEKSNLDVLNNILSEDYTVFIAKSGETALKKAKENLPDLIVLDIVMPDLNGFEVISALKQMEETRNIPIIFITGLNNPTNEENGFRLGAVDYITKPFNTSIVKARIRTQIQILKQIDLIETEGMIDPLSHLPNHRRFEINFYAEWRRAVREKTYFGLVLISIDQLYDQIHFYGRPLGERLITEVANTLRDSVRRPTDMVTMLEEDRFATILPGTDLSGTLKVAENMRSNVEALNVPDPLSGKTIKTTLSIGAATTQPEQEKSFKDFFESTEKLLLEAKNAGRNLIRS